SPDGRSVAAENADRTLTLWEVASAQERGRLGKPVAQRAQPDPGMAAVAFVVGDIPGGPAEHAGPGGVAFSAAGRALAPRGADGTVRVWDVTAGKEIRHYTGHGNPVATIAFARDGKALASGASDTTLLLWDTASLSKGRTAPPGPGLSAAEVEALWGELAGA